MPRQKTDSFAARPGRVAGFVFDVLRVALLGLCKLWFRVEVVGRSNIPAIGGCIVAPTHRSHLDTVLVASVFNRRLRFLGHESMWRYRPAAWLFSTLGGVPARRGSALPKTMRISRRVLDDGEPLVIFPEGTRVEGAKVGELLDGPTFLAGHTRTPVIPVGIGGSARAMGKGSVFPRPTRIVVVVGPAVRYERGRGSTDEEQVQTSGWAARRDQSEDLRNRLQEVFDEAQRRAGIHDA